GLAEVNAALDSAISSSQSVSIEAGRALRLGKEPTTPAWHWALTSSGPEAMNMGEPKTGRRSWESRSEREFTVPPWVDECMPPTLTERLINAISATVARRRPWRRPRRGDCAMDR